jgi:hypothetical protein
MICACCGDPIELGDVFVCVQQFQFGRDPKNNTPVFRPMSLEDGSNQKVAHPICLVEMGAPRSIIGAEGGRVDV